MSAVRTLFERVADRIIGAHQHTPPSFIVGGPDNPYLLRWYLTPWRRWTNVKPDDANGNRWLAFLVAAPWVQRLFGLLPNVYLHCFLRDDDDRALHDHPWHWCSLLLRGQYVEHTIAAGGIQRRQLRFAPSLKVSGPRRAHRIELLRQVTLSGAQPRPCWTLFATGPRLRRWGFHCPQQGWIDFERFTDPADTGKTGKGCEA